MHSLKDMFYTRGDSVFARPELYDLFEDNDVKYAIRLKVNKTQLELAQDEDESLTKANSLHLAGLSPQML